VKFLSYEHARKLVEDLRPRLDLCEYIVLDHDGNEIPWLGLNIEAGVDAAWTRLGITQDNDVVVVSFPEGSLKYNHPPTITSIGHIQGK
jgi:hypothetical protein